jgi:signal peptide peptidase SppA
MNGLQYPHLAARVFNTPLLIHPQKLDAIIAGIGSRLLGGGLSAQPVSINAVDANAAQLLPAEMFSTRRGARSDRGYQVVDGVAVVGVRGALVHRTRMDADSTMLLGYNDVAADIEDAMNNTDVHAVMLSWDSPGGEVQGAFELAERIASMRGKKPMISMADSMAASAAYLGASASDEVVLTSTAYLGSIGVVMRHVDFSKALEADGVKVTHIYAGAHKVDGNPYEPLPDSVRADYQLEIDDLMTMFVETVAKNTGLDPMAIRKMQAGTYRGVSAVAAGLASRISTSDQILSELAATRSRSFPSGQAARATANQGDSMSGNTTPGGQASPAATAFSQADIDQARAAGAADGAKAERERVGAILTHEKASANMAMAVQCVNSGLTAEQAGAILGAAPAPIVAVQASAGNAFAAAMAATGNPQVSGVEASGDAANEEAALAGQILAAFSLGKAKA